jgi:very-short-patch-repair endonuclease
MGRQGNETPRIAARRSPRDAVTWLAERQHAVVKREQLLATGFTRHEIARLLAASRLHRVHRCVYAVGHRKLTDEGRWLAAVFAAGDGAVLSHESAAALWKMLPPRRGPIQVTAPVKRRSHQGIAVRRAKLERSEIRVRNRIPVTSPERTLLDLAASNPRLLDKAIREAHYLHLTSAASLAAVCKRHEGRPGTRALKRAIENADLDKGPTREELEHLFRRFLRKHNLPIPLFNAPLEINGRVIHPDCLWRDHRLIVELDSRKAHATPHAFEEDRARDRALQVAGYRVIRITWRQLRDEPEAISGDLSALLIG